MGLFESLITPILPNAKGSGPSARLTLVLRIRDGSPLSLCCQIRASLSDVVDIVSDDGPSVCIVVLADPAVSSTPKVTLPLRVTDRATPRSLGKNARSLI